jgi:hypothetical protein
VGDSSPRLHVVDAREHEKLVRFVFAAIEASGCRIVSSGTFGVTPLRVRFETPAVERMDVLVYAVVAPKDDRGGLISVAARAEDEPVDDLWHDPRGVIATLSIAIDVARGVFVGMDLLDYDGTAEIERLRVSREDVERVLATRWHAWERDRADEEERVEVLVGSTAGNFLRPVGFERDAFGEEAGERRASAERAWQVGRHEVPGR